jgi:hypothetical protein
MLAVADKDEELIGAARLALLPRAGHFPGGTTQPRSQQWQRFTASLCQLSAALPGEVKLSRLSVSGDPVHLTKGLLFS